jgi:hypothetical protein
VSHEFIASSEQPEYEECIRCKERKSMICLTCGYCYECHPKKEEIERKSDYVPDSAMGKLRDIESK